MAKSFGVLYIGLVYFETNFLGIISYLIMRSQYLDSSRHSILFLGE